MATGKTFKGYGPEQGYGFLRDAIAKNSYHDRGVDISADDIFISDGSKCDTGNIQEIFDHDNKIAICDPVYPVYADTTVMAGKTGVCQANGYYEGIIYMPCTAENHFIPDFQQKHPDLIFLCFPNNPTGTVATKEELKNGWIMPSKTKQSFCMMQLTKLLLPTTIFHIRYTKLKVQKLLHSNFAVFRKQQDLPEPVGFYSNPKELMAYDKGGNAHQVKNCGTVVIPLNSMAFRTRCKKRRQLFFPKTVKKRLLK